MRTCGNAFVFALSLLAAAAMLYASAYLLTVDQMFSPVEGYQCAPSYNWFGRRLDGTFIPRIFAPIQRLDVRLRPGVWVFHNEQAAAKKLECRLTMRCSEPGHRALVAIQRPRGPGR